MAINATNIIAITGVIQAIICSIIFLFGIWGFIKGWYKGFQRLDEFTTKANLFLNNMLPDILNYLGKTERIPDNSLSKWTTLLSDGRIKSQSPLSIADKGSEIIAQIGLDKIFNENKDMWADTVNIKIQSIKPAAKYTIEKECISYISNIFDTDDAFKPILNYLYENPKENKYEFIVMTGILLRDYYFEKYSENVFN